MKKSYEPKVVLPRVDAAAGDILGKALVTAIRAERRLPSLLAGVAKRLEGAHEALSAVTGDRRVFTTREDRGKMRRTEAVTWKALQDTLGALATLPHLDDVEVREEARAIYGELFADGLAWFTARPYGKAWLEAGHRLERIDEDLEERLRTLGVGLFLDAVRRAHGLSGEILGITKVGAPDPEPPQVRMRRDAFVEALREYVFQVVAYSRQERAGLQELAARLLLPLARHQPAAPKAAKEPADEQAPPVEAEVTPDASPDPSPA